MTVTAMLKYFRAPDLSFWTAVVLVLGALLAAAWWIGSGHEAGTPLPGVPAVPDATQSAAREAVADLQGLQQAGIAAGNEPQALKDWARAIAGAAGEGVAARTAEGAPDDDDLLSELIAVRRDAETLGEAAADPVAAQAWRTRIGLRVSRCALLTSGVPAPPVPTGEGTGVLEDLFAPTVPDADDPGTPPAPTVPPVTTRPSVPPIP